MPNLGSVSILALPIMAFLISCQNPSASDFFYGSLGVTPKLIITSSSSVTASPFLAVQYSLSGQFEKVLIDTTFENRILRGLAPIDAFHFLISTDTVDSILNLDMFNGRTTWVANGNLSGNIYDLRRASNGQVFVIETTNIESFDSDGNRIGNPRIPSTAIGACQITTAARGMAIDRNGTVVVGSQGNDDILFFDVSNPSATSCLAANTSLGNVDPVAVIAHSNGFIYVAATSGTDAVYRINGDGTGSATAIWTGATTSNPTAMTEMPDGSILLALDGTNNIIKIDTSGNVLANPFIQDGFTNYVQDMMITGTP